MSCPHLDFERYRSLRAGTLDGAEARRLAAHLAEPCDVCEEFLATLPTDGLDGETDAALARLSGAGAGHDLEWARIRRRLRGGGWSRRAWAAAAVLLLAVGVGWTALELRPPADEVGIKGVSAREAIPARLRFAVIEGGPGEARLVRARSGAEVPSGASLTFRVEVGRPAHLAVLRLGEGQREVVWRGRAERPGELDVAEGGRPAAYPLRGLTGRQRFALVASPEPLAEDDLAAAAREATRASSVGGSRGAALSLDVVEVLVRE